MVDPAPATTEEKDLVLEWRIHYLLASGYDEEAARMLAENREVDLSKAADLLRNGCSATLALLILL